MSQAAAATNLSQVQQLETAHEMISLLGGVNIGIAIYSSERFLLAANDAFYRYHALEPEQLPIGTHFDDVLLTALAAKKIAKDAIGYCKNKIIEKLDSEDSSCIQVENLHGQHVRVSRYKKSTGMIVETLEALGKEVLPRQDGNSGAFKYAETISAEQIMSALNNMADGFGLFDAEGRLIAYNKNYEALNPESQGTIHIGARFSDIIGTIHDNGRISHEGSTREEFIAFAEQERLAPTGPTAHRNIEGKWVRFSGYRLEDGSTIFTASDTSKLKESEERAEALGKKAAGQERILRDALANMSDAICMYESDGTPLTFNEKYRKLFLASDVFEKARHSAIQISRDASENAKHSEEKLQRLLEQYRNNGFPEDRCAFLVTLKDGRVFEVRYKPLENGRSILTGTDVTRRTKDAERIARQSERLTHLITSMSQGICVYSADNRLEFSNDQYLELLNIDPALAKPGVQRIDIVENILERNNYTDEKAEQVLEKYRQNAFLKKPGTNLHELTNGRIVEIHNNPLEDGKVIVTATDVTQREHDAAVIDQKTQYFNEALQNMAQGLCFFDQDNRIIVKNDRYTEVLGLQPDDVKTGITRFELFKTLANHGLYSKADFDRLYEVYKDPSFTRQQGTILHKMTNGKIIESFNNPLDDGRTIVMITDVTEREKQARQLQRYTDSLERSNAELQDFAYVASHDLQEPLRKIEAFGDRLSKKYGDTLPEDGQMYLDRMQNASSRMRQLISDLLAYSRITSKAQPLTPVDLNEVLEGVLSDIQMRIEETNGQVNAALLPQIDADPTQMRQLFQNIISNALKFNKPGVNPVITVTGRTVVSPDNREMLRIDIADNGIGFDNRHKDQIFAIFKRLHGRAEYEGTGIGLSTCRKIVERHQGTIEANGVPDEGSTFTIVLPKKQTAETEQIA